MATNFTQNDLDAMGLTKNPDGTYSKKKTVKQPREVSKPYGDPPRKDIEYSFKDGTNVILQEYLPFNDTVTPANKKVVTVKLLRKLTLNLFGIPMPKQSVRATKDGHFFQPQKTVDRKKDYQRQIRKQLPEGFIRFEQRVHITKMHFVFPPLKGFHKIKGRMEALRSGEIFYKETKPDLPDNLKKLANDAMSEIVFKDDSIIVSEDNVKKYYGTGGMLVIEMEGY